MIGTIPQQLEFAYSHARELVRAADPDRYIATLFAPEGRRPHLFAIYAFNLEIARIRDVISQPLPGEVRLQWWRDVIDAAGPTIAGSSVEGDGPGHPVALALLNTISENHLPKQAFLDMLEARIYDLYDDLMPGWHDLEGYCGETSSALFRLATLVLSGGAENGAAEACGHAGVAYGLTLLLKALPLHAARGQVYLPQEALNANALNRDDIVARRRTASMDALLAQTRAKIWDHLAQTHAFGRDVAPELHPAFLPLATLTPQLKQMAKADYNLFESRIELPNWQRIWLMWRFRL